jgi:hypothetical protein
MDPIRTATARSLDFELEEDFEFADVRTEAGGSAGGRRRLELAPPTVRTSAQLYRELDRKRRQAQIRARRALGIV